MKLNFGKENNWEFVVVQIGFHLHVELNTNINLYLCWKEKASADVEKHVFTTKILADK